MKSSRLGLFLTLAITASFLLGIWYQTNRSKHPSQVPPDTSPNLFSDIISNATSQDVIPFDSSAATHQELLQLISKAAALTTAHFNQADSPVKGIRRINEASRYFEDHLCLQLNQHPEIDCQPATTAAGKAQRSGYPDLHLTHRPTGTHFYLDPKLYEETAETSSLRTFYYSPTSPNQKVQHAATHLLIGFSHDGQDGNWTFTGWKITDLARLELRLKTEYNASNKALYSSQHILRQERPAE